MGSSYLGVLSLLNLRRIEDKMDQKAMLAARVSIRMESGHGNRKLPLLYTAWVAISDSSTRNIFAESKMLTTERPVQQKPLSLEASLGRFLHEASVIP